MTAEVAAETTADEIIGELVHQVMWRRQISQTEIGAAIGVAQPNVARRLRGKTSWTVDELLLVARYLEVDLSELLPPADYVPAKKWAPGRKNAVPGGGTAFLPMRRIGLCANRDSNPEPADLQGPRRLLLHLHAQRPVAHTGHGAHPSGHPLHLVSDPLDWSCAACGARRAARSGPCWSCGVPGVPAGVVDLAAWRAERAA